MAVASRTFRNRMLLTTAVAALTAIPSAAHAQLVRNSDLSSAVDSGGNPNQLTVTDTNATTTDIEVEAAVVVAEWTDFNVDMGDTVNVTIDAGLGIAEATLFNRVIGGNPSNINGTINASGINFWLVNQNGIMFGADTQVNARSFFASTLDVANQDIFDFYEGTDLFLNGTETLNFFDPTPLVAEGITSASGATFNLVGDGSLMFAGQQLNLTGTFDADLGRAAFVSATDIDVTFTPGSPLTYTVNAGTTIAAAQTVGGTVEGASTDFAMITAAGVVGALLQVDATVTATTAVATDTGVSLVAQGQGVDKPNVLLNGAITNTGQMVAQSEGNLTATANISSSDIDLDATGAISTADLTSTDGSIDLNAGTTITAGVLDTSGNGGAILTAAGNITTTSITSNEPGATNGFIDVESTGGGTLDLGNLSSDGDIALDTSGLVTTGSITTLNDLTIGGTTTATTVTFTGNVDADIVDIDATGTVSGLAIDATDGDLDINAGVINAGAVSATGGDVILQATGNVTTTSITSTEDAFNMGGAIDVDSTGGGTLDLGTVTGDGAANFDTTGTLTLGTVDVGGAMEIGGTNDPATLNLNGNVTAGSFTTNTAIAFATANDITATDGDLNITAASIDTGDLEADNGGGVILTSPGNITTTSITSNEPGATNGFIDVESTGGGTLDLGNLSSDGDIALDTAGSLTTGLISTLGDLTIGGTTDPSSINFTGNVSADLVDVDSTGTVTGLNIDATDGNLDINANVIDAADVSATGGDVILQATGNVTTTSITSTEDAFNMGGAIDVDSTGGGTLDLGTITGDGAANFDTTGTLTLGTVDVGGAMEIGGFVDPSTLNLNGDITAGSFATDSATAFSTTNAITTTSGDIDIAAPTITTAALDANGGGGVILTAPGNITTASITANEPGVLNGFVDVESTGGGALDLGDVQSDGDIALDTAGSLTTGLISTLGDLTIGGTTDPSSINFTGNVSADLVDVDSTGTVTGLNIDATDGNLDINANVIDADDVSATGGDVILQSTGNVTTTSITSTEDAFNMGGAIDVDSTGGSLDLGTVASDGLTDLDAGADITTGTITTTAGDINLNAGNDINTGALDANGGGGAIVTATGNITTASITANEPGVLNGFIDVDSTGGGDLDLGALASDGNISLDTTGAITTNTISSLGDLTVGNFATPTTVTFNGNVSADSVDIDATGLVDGMDIEATDGDANINAGSIDAGHVSASRGNVILQATGSITTTSITAERVMGTGGDIDVDSTGGGNLTLGDLTADSNVELDTTGILTYGNLDAPGGLVDIGSTAMPSLIIVTGNQTVIAFVANSVTDFIANDITTTNGAIDITAPNISTGHLNATGGDVILLSPGDITTTSIISNESGGMGGAIDVDSTGGGNLDLGDLTSDGLITLDTLGDLTIGTVMAGGALDIGSTNMPAATTFNGDITALSFAFTTTDPLNLQNVTTTGGDLDLSADEISALALSATGGDVVLTAVNNITTTSITAVQDMGIGGAIDVDSTAGGALDLGDLDATTTIDLDTTGTLEAGTVMAGGALTVGAVNAPSSITFTGNVVAGSVDIDTAGSLDAQDLSSTAGAIVIDAADIMAGAVGAVGGNADLTATGAISTTSISSDASIDVDSTAGGALDLGALDAANAISLDTTGTVETAMIMAGGALSVGATNAPSSITFTDNVTAGSIDLDTPGSVSAQDLTATAGDILIDPGQLTAGALSATGDVDIDTAGDVTLTSITADSDNDTNGNVLIGVFTSPANLTVTGATTGAQVGIVAGSIDLGDVTANSGTVIVIADALNAENVSSNGGNTQLISSGNITTTSVSSTEVGLAGGIIDIDSTGGGNLDLGTLTADEGISLDTTGTVRTGSVDGDNDADGTGTLQIGATALPSTVRFTGNVTAASIDIDASGAVRASDDGMPANDTDLTATNGSVDIAATSLTAATVSATGGDVIANVSGTVSTSAITTDGMIDVDSTGGGNLDLGDLTADAGITLDTSGSIRTGTVSADDDADGVGTLQIGGTTLPSLVRFTGNVAGAIIDIDATGDVIGRTVGAPSPDVDLEATTGSLDIDAATISIGDATAATSATLTATGAIQSGNVSAMGGDATLTGSSIQSGMVSAAGNAVLDATGAITTGNVTATSGGAIDVDSTAGGNVALGDLAAENGITLDTTGDLTTGAINSDTDGNNVGGLQIGSVAAPSSLTINGAVSAPAIDITVNNLVSVGDMATTNGDLSLNGTQIDGGNLAATGGDISLNATGDITTTSLTATAGVMGGAIAVKSTGGGALDLGDLSAENGIMLDTTGTLEAGAVDADSDADLAGDLMIGTMEVPGSVTLTGNATGANVSIISSGLVDTQDVTASNGDLDIDSGSIAAAALAATGNIDLDAGGSIGFDSATADSDANLSGAVAIGTTTVPSDIAAAGDITGTSVSLETTGVLAAANITATDGGLSAIADDVTADDVTATGDVTILGTGDLSLANALADSDADLAGSLNLVGDGSLTIAGAASGVNATAQSSGAIALGDFTATNGDATALGDSIAADNVAAAGGDAVLTANSAVVTSLITSVGGSIDVDSTGGGQVDVGDLNSDGTVALDTSGAVSSNAINATGAVSVGATTQTAAVNFGADVQGESVDVNTAGALTGNGVTANSGDLDIDASSITSTDLDASGNVRLDTSGAIAITSATADSGGTGTGDLIIGSSQLSATDLAGANVDIQTGNLEFDNTTASGDVNIVSNTIGDAITDRGLISANGSVTVDGSGSVNLLQVIADADNNGTGEVAIGANITPTNIRIAEGAQGTSISLQAAGGGIGVGRDATSAGLVATDGDITVSTSAAAGTGSQINITSIASATGGNVTLEANNDISAGEIVATQVGMNGGAIAILSFSGGDLFLGSLTADNGVSLDTTNTVRTLDVQTDDDGDNVGGLVIGAVEVPDRVRFLDSVESPSITVTSTGEVEALDLTASAGSIDIDAAQISGDDFAATGDVLLDANQTIGVASITADSDTNGTGDVVIGADATPSRLTIGIGDPATMAFTGGGVSGANVTLNSESDVDTGAITASAGDTAIDASGDIRIRGGGIDTTALTVSAGDSVTIEGDVNAGGTGLIEGDDVNLPGNVNVGGDGLTLRANDGQSVGIGDGAGDFRLTDEELDRIVTNRLVIDAGSASVNISNVSFEDATGSDEVVVATTGGSNSIIQITGDIDGTGDGRVFRFGGDVDGTADVLANRITADIEEATINLGTATLDLRAIDIVFGQQELIGSLNGKTSGFVSVNFVGNAGSRLFDPLPLGGDRVGDPVYLRVGSLSLTYGESAVFQNTIPLTEGDVDFDGVAIGQINNNGSLILNPTDLTNTFAIFGSLNELSGDAVAFAPDPDLQVDGDTQLFASRANGCVIRSGADCITTIIDSTIISVPRDAVSLLTADPDVFLPFDPLVGTNNEGLFSGATAVPDDEDCERDENGACIGS